jgi:DNA processing protein
MSDGIRVVELADEEYPPMLRHIPNPPERLYVRGLRLDRLPRMLAVVGTRTPTPYGEQMTHDLASDLALAGFCIVSGLARGLDRKAHEGALAVGGTTVAVLGTAIDHIHPSIHNDLARNIMRNGAVVSELPPGATTHKSNFPLRNRIIAGMSLGVVITQAARKSGARQTTRLARDFGRAVFAVPGNIDVEGSVGPHAEIRGGAKLCTGAGDVLTELDQVARVNVDREVTTEQIESLPPVERALLGAMSRTPRSVESICVRSGLEARVALATLTRLELDGLVAEAQNGGWVRM